MISFTKHKHPIYSEDLEVLYAVNHLGLNAPESFANSAWFNTILYFGKRGRENQREMKPNWAINWRFSASLLGQMFIFRTISQPRTLSADIPAAWRALLTKYPSIFKTARVAKKIWSIIKTIASIWGENVRIFVLGHYLFLVAHSFPRTSLSENCSLLGKDDVRGQIPEHIFAPNGGYCLFTRNDFQNIYVS